MVTIITLAVTTTGTLVSFAVILVQFIGTTSETLQKLAVLQLICLVVASFFAICIYLKLAKNSAKKKSIIKELFITMPGWLIFILLLLIITALLGDLSVLLVRLTGHELTNLFHLPSICIVIFCFVYAFVHYDLVISKK